MLVSLPHEITCFGKSTVIKFLFSACLIKISFSELFTFIGKIPFLKQLLKKISAKLGAIMHLKPKSNNDQGACSLLLPQPKLSPVISILAFL